jgi:spore coat polysaccharide biosynthesis protein SpsF (cytidylyltransferase family)
MKNLCIVQARMSSSRFPGKVMALLEGIPLIDILIDRLSSSKSLDHIVIATSNEPSDDILVDHLKNQDVFRGSLLDVRSRFIEIAKQHNPKNIVRITADCPLACPQLIDDLIALHMNTDSDYSANCNVDPFPKGFDVEIFKAKILKFTKYLNRRKYDKEHVTPWMYKYGNLNVSNLEFNKKSNMSNFNFSVDEISDLRFLEELAVKIPILQLTFRQIYDEFEEERQLSS